MNTLCLYLAWRKTKTTENSNISGHINIMKEKVLEVMICIIVDKFHGGVMVYPGMLLKRERGLREPC